MPESKSESHTKKKIGLAILLIIMVALIAAILFELFHNKVSIY